MKTEEQQHIIDLWNAGDEENMRLAWGFMEWAEGIEYWDLYWEKIEGLMKDAEVKVEKEFNFMKSMLGKGGVWLNITFLGVKVEIEELHERMVMNLTFNEDFDRVVTLFPTAAGFGWKTEKNFGLKFQKVIDAMREPLKKEFDESLFEIMTTWLKKDDEGRES